jgi:hypothetical protein
MDDSKFVLLGTYTPEETDPITSTWDSFRQEPSTDQPGLVTIYVCPEEKDWREKQCSSDI